MINPVQFSVTSAPEPKSAGAAAKDFEALLIAQMLKGARESGSGGWLGTGEDGPGMQAMALADEHFARALAASGGFGLSRLIEASFGPEAAESAQALKKIG